MADRITKKEGGAPPRKKPKSKRRPWGLLGLLGLLGGGLWLASAAGSEAKAKAWPKRAKTKPKRAPLTPRPLPEPRPANPKTKPGNRPTVTGGRDIPSTVPDVGDLIVDYPQAERFYRVVYGDTFASISSRYLKNEAYLAAKEHGDASDSEALAFASKVASSGTRRLAITDLYQCSGWNDALYGAKPRLGTRVSATGRSILLLPQHAPVAQLLLAGEPPSRNVRVSSGTGVDTTWRSFELLWGPAVDRKALWESGGSTITTLGMLWPNGSSKENPPPTIMDLGMDDESGELDIITSWGCPGSDGEIDID